MKKDTVSRLQNRLPVFLAAVFLMLVLAGCGAGSSVDTTLILNSDLSGVRQMTVTIDQKVFEQNFNGTVENINALLETQCPPELTWSYSDADGNMRYCVSLEFSSLDDYRAKVAAILGSDPQINISVPDSIWASGISVEESFTSLDLLNWMKDLLVNNQFVDASNAGYIFNAGSTDVTYQDQSYTTGNYINLNQMSYVSLDAIHILTQINEDGSYNRKVVVRIPGASMNQKSEEIQAYLNGVVPAGAKAEWGEDGGLTVFTVSAENLTAQQLAEFDRAVFDTEDVTVNGADVSESYSPFTFANSLSESINLDGYLSDRALPYSYQVKTADSYTAYWSDDGVNGGNAGYDSQDFSGYKVLREGAQSRNNGPVTFSVLVQKAYGVRELKVETERTAFGSGWKRTSSFVLDAVPSEEEQAAILERMQARAGIEEDQETGEDSSEPETDSDETDSGETGSKDVSDPGEETETKEESDHAKVTVSGETDKDGVYSLTVVQKGKAEEISQSSETIFGSADQIFYGVDRGFAKVKRADAFSEKVRFGNLLSNTTDDFKISYTAKMGLFSQMSYCSVDSAQMDGNKLSAVFYGKEIDIDYAGTKLNLWGLLFWILIVVGIVSVVILLVKLQVFGKMFKKAGGAKAAPAASGAASAAPGTAPAAPGTVPEASGTTSAVFGAAPEVSGAAPTAPGTVSEASGTAPAAPKAAMFCEKCGTPRVAGSRFCEKCGAKFEDAVSQNGQ